MAKIFLTRTLWHLEKGERKFVDQAILTTDPRSFVVLGEAGMGKSTLLDRLRDLDGYTICSARKLLNHSAPRALLGNATNLVIDALDEVAARQEGDAVDLILQRLGQIGRPRFILSCRVSDWRRATALQGFAEIYDCPPVELYLEPFTREEAVAYLTAGLGAVQAHSIMDSLDANQLTGLWGNPQTLELVENVSRDGRPPESKGDLFARAVDLMRREARETSNLSPLAIMPASQVLDAAGCAFATLILAGKEALSQLNDDDDVAIAELTSLQGGQRLFDVLGSRLFANAGPDRLTYTHRAVGEFLGARWLSRVADTARKRKRVLDLFHSKGLVPVSLRGLHAWLAWHSADFAPAVIAADPMGVIDYGDTGVLNPHQARLLLESLLTISQNDPEFREWKDYNLAGLAQPALVGEIRRLLRDPNFGFGLRLLLLQALKQSPVAAILAADLETLLLDEREEYSLRYLAGYRLTEIDPAPDWPSLVATLGGRPNEICVRLAAEMMQEVGYARFDTVQIIELIVAQLPWSDRHLDDYRTLERDLEFERLDDFLDRLAATATGLGTRDNRVGNAAITDLATLLTARRLSRPGVDPRRLWSWLEPFSTYIGSPRTSRDALADRLRQQDDLRRALQRLIILNDDGEATIWARYGRLRERSDGFEPNDADVASLLDALPDGDTRWREIVQLVPHLDAYGAVARAAAARFAAGSQPDEDWLEALSKPRADDLQRQEELRHLRIEEAREKLWLVERDDYRGRIAEMRAGAYSAIIKAARVYLNRQPDMGRDHKDGFARLAAWLGPDLASAALEGFEAFLQKDPPVPSAQQIVDSYAESRQWPAVKIVIAALIERVRTGRGFDEVSDDRLVGCFIDLSHSSLRDNSGLPDLETLIADELRARGLWEAVQRLRIEPLLERRFDTIQGIYPLTHTEADANLATKLAGEWLERFPQIASYPEIELIRHLMKTQIGRAVLRASLPQRRQASLDTERRRCWAALGLILDFETEAVALDARGSIEPELLWALRARLDYRGSHETPLHLSAAQLVWMIEAFRPLFPVVERPSSGGSGDTNPWDASEEIMRLARRLGDDTSPDAIAALARLRDAPADGYSRVLAAVDSAQKRKWVEAAWEPPRLETIRAAVVDLAPVTAEQLRVVVVDALAGVADKLRGSDVDWYTDFYEGGAHRSEDACRDAVIKMMRPLDFGIHALPEGHLADDKRCDILCLLGQLMVPIEVKGQWHDRLWSAADDQLDLFYSRDGRAAGGIYLVLWFGQTVSLRRPLGGGPMPMSAAELQAALEARSQSAREGRTHVIVLDLTRPA